MLSPFVELPDPQGPLIASGGQPAPVRVESQRINPALVRVELRKPLATFSLIDPEGLLRTGKRQLRPIGAIACRENQAGLLLKLPELLQ